MLIDDVMRFYQQSSDQRQRSGAHLMHLALRFEVNNVASFCYTSEYSDKSLVEEFPNIAPVAETMWFEFTMTKIGNRTPPGEIAGAFLVVIYDKSKPETHKHITIYKSMIEQQGGDPAPDGLTWRMSLDIYYRERMKIKESVDTLIIDVDGDGKLIQAFKVAKSETSQVTEGLTFEQTIALTSLCFLHCKNIVVVDHSPSRQVRRAAERGRQAVYTYKTLDIHPIKKVLERDGNVQKNGIVRALHICRGHFATYTQEKPLFGKYAGTFYIPMHARGSEQKGITVKDYKIHTE